MCLCSHTPAACWVSLSATGWVVQAVPAPAAVCTQRAHTAQTSARHNTQDFRRRRGGVDWVTAPRAASRASADARRTMLLVRGQASSCTVQRTWSQHSAAIVVRGGDAILLVSSRGVVSRRRGPSNSRPVLGSTTFSRKQSHRHEQLVAWLGHVAPVDLVQDGGVVELWGLHVARPKAEQPSGRELAAANQVYAADREARRL